MSSLGLSRSRRHGLRADQPQIWFHFDAPEMDVEALFAAPGLKRQPLRLTDELRQLLDKLVRYDIE